MHSSDTPYVLKSAKGPNIFWGSVFEFKNKEKNGILLPKLFWPTVRKKCSTDREKLLKFKVEGREFAKFSRSLEQFIHTVEGQKIFVNRMLF